VSEYAIDVQGLNKSFGKKHVSSDLQARTRVEGPRVPGRGPTNGPAAAPRPAGWRPGFVVRAHPEPQTTRGAPAPRPEHFLFEPTAPPAPSRS
jgi:hypothetical protein